MAIEVTDEMRKAVFAELCQEEGHNYSLVEMFSPAPGRTDNVGYDVRNPDPNKLPHVACSRCGKTWIFLNEPGTSYDDVEEKLRSKLKDPKDIDALREKRKPNPTA